jgi:tetratricopeptide (TPR) repeat protein
MWFAKVDDDGRTRLGAVRELFGRQAEYDAWLARVTKAREADLIAGLPRLLLTQILLHEGKYASARLNLSVALRAEPRNAMLKELDRILSQTRFDRDADTPARAETPDPIVLLARAETMFREKKYTEARSLYLAAAEGDPGLKGIAVALVRAEFAVGDYDAAAAALEKLLAGQNVAEAGHEAFSLPLSSGYTDQAEFAAHLEALAQACEQRKLSSGPWLLLGAIRYAQRDFGKARDALSTYADNVRGAPNIAALKLLENARKLAKR